MTIARARIHARVGLLGNPSDGYGGAALAFTFDALSCAMEARTDEAAGFRFDWDGETLLRASTVEAALAGDPRAASHGALRLCLAALRQLAHAWQTPLPDALGGAGLHIAASSSIPLQAGLSGSSAIALASIRSVAALCGRPLGVDAQAQRALAAETDELGIAAGPMDRIAQARNGLQFMDFAGTAPHVEAVAPAAWPAFFVAWARAPGEASGVVHGGLRARFQRREPAVREAMRRFAEIARAGREALERGDDARLGALIDENFDLRGRVVGAAPRDRALVALAREAGREREAVRLGRRDRRARARPRAATGDRARLHGGRARLARTAPHARHRMNPKAGAPQRRAGHPPAP